MSPALEKLEEDLLLLSERDRVQLATTLLSSLPIPAGILELGTPEFETEIEVYAFPFHMPFGAAL